jgi:membrane peptidoglycan carboxypeptidase
MEKFKFLWSRKALVAYAILIMLLLGSFFYWLHTEKEKAKADIAGRLPELEKYREIGVGVHSDKEVVLVGDRLNPSYLIERLSESGFKNDAGACSRCYSWNSAAGMLVVKQPKEPRGKEQIYQNGIVRVRYQSGEITDIQGEGNQLIIPPKFLRQNDNTSRQNASGKENPNLRRAIMAAEDKRFFEHSGVDYFALIGALISQARFSEDVQAHGTTLTMQLVKGLMLESMNRSVWKQWKAMVYAIAIEELVNDKDQLIQIYENHVYLGPGTYGLAMAAERYFNSGIENLNTWQCAALAGKLRNPGAYEPTDEKKRQAWATRTNQVLAAMGETTKVEAKNFNRPTQTVTPALRFVQFVWSQATDKHFATRIETTINPYLQKVVEDVFRGIGKLPQPQGGKLGTQLLALIIDPQTGKILAESQKGDYQGELLNARFTGGSVLKTFVYAEAMNEDKLDDDDKLPDTDENSYPGAGGRPWTPTNMDHKYLGDISFKQAFDLSRNPPVVYVANKLGFENVRVMFQTQGFSGCRDAVPTIAIGQFGVTPGELALAYAQFANMGLRPTQLTAVESVVSLNAINVGGIASGMTNYFSPETLRRMNGAMHSVVLDGTLAKAGKSLGEFRDVVFGKTGSTDEGVCVVLFTQRLIMVVWAGSVEYKKLRGSAGKIVGPIAAEIMRRVLTTLPRYAGKIEFEEPKEEFFTPEQPLEKQVEEVMQGAEKIGKEVEKIIKPLEKDSIKNPDNEN